MSEQADGDLDDLAERVRAIYWRIRGESKQAVTGQEEEIQPKPVARYDGGTDPDGRRFKPVWPKLAAYYLRQGVDPEEAIRAVFADYLGGEPPQPLQLMSGGLRDKVEAAKQRRFNSVVRAVEAEKTAFQEEKSFQERYGQLKPVPLLRSLLTSPRLVLSPLFRHCVALRCGLGDLADHYKEDAFRQYVRQPMAYDAVWTGLIPDDFRHRLAGVQTKASEVTP